MTSSSPGLHCLYYIFRYFAVAIWKKDVPCLLFFLKLLNQPLKPFWASVTPTDFPRAHPLSLTAPFPHEGRLSQLKKKKDAERICVREIEKKGNMLNREFVSCMLCCFSHTDNQKKSVLYGLNSAFEYRNGVRPGQMWHVILCDFIIRLLPQCGCTASVCYYRGRRVGAEWVHHEEAVTDPCPV